jgi:hypothetical protein
MRDNTAVSVASPSGSRQGKLEVLKAAARQRTAAGQMELALGLEGAAASAKHSKPSSATAEVRTSLSQLRMVRKWPHG